MRVVVVEDQAFMREFTCRLCRAEPDCKLLGAAEDGVRAIELIFRTAPDLVLLDLELGSAGMDGFAVAEAVRSRMPFTRFLILSSYCDDHMIARIERARFHGYVDKTTNAPEALGRAMGIVAGGGRYFSDRYLAAKAARLNDPRSYEKLLSARECEVLGLIGQALSDDEIAAQLAISPETATTHRKKIMGRLGIHSTPKLITYAIRTGLAKAVPYRRG